MKRLALGAAIASPAIAPAYLVFAWLRPDTGIEFFGVMAILLCVPPVIAWIAAIAAREDDVDVLVWSISAFAVQFPLLVFTFFALARASCHGC